MYDTYVSIDLETTGLNPKRDRIIEIGAIRVEQGQIVEEFSTFVDPGRKLEERITELTGIRDEDLADAPQLDEVFPKLLEFMGELPLLGHSILFDYSFLKKAAVDRKITFERSAVDTLQIARKYLPELPHRNLGYLCQYYEIPHHAHRALEDAKATDRLFRKLIELFYREETGGQASTEAVGKSTKNNLFEPQPLHFQVKRDTPATKPQKERLYRLAEQHKITLEVDAVRRAGLRIRFLQSTDDRITQSGTQSFCTVDQIGNFVIFLPAGIDFSQRIVSMADVGADGDGIRENRFRIICQTGIQKQIGPLLQSTY